MKLADPLARYATLITWGLRVLALAAIAAVAWYAAILPRSQRDTARTELAEEQRAHRATKADHAATLAKLAADSAAVAQMASKLAPAFERAKQEDAKTHQKEVADAYERGKGYAARIAAGDVRVRDVWRDLGPIAISGPSAGPASGAAGIPWGRAQAIGEVRGLGGEFDASYDLLWKRLGEAQVIVDACYEQPAGEGAP